MIWNRPWLTVTVRDWPQLTSTGHVGSPTGPVGSPTGPVWSLYNLVFCFVLDLVGSTNGLVGSLIYLVGWYDPNCSIFFKSRRFKDIKFDTHSDLSQWPPCSSLLTQWPLTVAPKHYSGLRAEGAKAWDVLRPEKYYGVYQQSLSNLCKCHQ